MVERPGHDRTKAGEVVSVAVSSENAYLFAADESAFKRRVTF